MDAAPPAAAAASETALPLLVAAVAHASAWRRLQSLEVENLAYYDCTLQRATFKLLARSVAPTLRALHLWWLPIGAGGAAELAAAPWRLTALMLDGCALTSNALATLARHPASLSQLVRLDISHNIVSGGDDGGRGLAQLLGALPSLRRMSCFGANMGGWGAPAVVLAAPAIGRLTALVMSGNPVGDAGAAALAAWGVLPVLRALSVAEVGPAGMQALSESRVLAALTFFDCRGGGMGVGGLPFLLSSIACDAPLEVLLLHCSAAASIGGSLTFPTHWAVRKLSLTDVAGTPADAALLVHALVAAPWFEGLVAMLPQLQPH